MLSGSKADILEYLKAEFERASGDVTRFGAERLEAKIVVPMGERVVKALLMTQLSHVPYHYGQVKLNAKQLG
jgi:hypothetical protein